MTPIAPSPDASFAMRPLQTTSVAAGTEWRRMYETRYPNPLGYGLGLSRFSDPTGNAFGLLYLGSSAKVCFVETVLRDRADGRGPDCIVAIDEIDRRSLATIIAVYPLELVDLTGDGPLRVGVPSDVAGARDQSLAQRWSLAFHDHPDRPDGVLYPSRLNEQRCIALYSRAAGKLKVTATPRLMDCRPELAAILNDLEISLV